MRLDKKIAVVTGGAEGIGRAIAQRFLEEGATVVVADSNDQLGKQTVVELSNIGCGSCQFVKTDVTQEKEILALADQVQKEHGHLDILVNNAAIFILKGIEATSDEWHRILSTNVVGTALMCQKMVPLLKKSSAPAIVNLGSISSFIAQPEFVTYNATKAAIASMTKCLALDLAPENIRVNAVCPGTVWTQIVQHKTEEAGLTREEADIHPDWGAAHMIPRIAEPVEIANAALFLASEEASFITAECLMVDGGYTAK